MPRFYNHLTNEHGVVFEMEFILVACRLQQVEREKFREMMEIRLDKIDNEKREGGRKRMPNHWTKITQSKSMDHQVCSILLLRQLL